MDPSYIYPLQNLLGLTVDALIGRRRSFRMDARACIERLKPALRVLGRENIPPVGPCLLTHNHYYRPGFHVWWVAFAVATVVPEDVHFTIANEFTYPGKWYEPLGRDGSRWLLERIARTYGLSTMPPMPPRPKDTEHRAASVRALLAYARSHPQGIMALAPEGGDQPGGILAWPPAGIGRFIGLLTSGGMPVVPVGAYEEAGCFCLSFGEPYQLSVPRGLSADEKDRHAAEIVMRAMARQLPSRLRGAFGEAHSDVETNRLAGARTE